jgi:hypothetical protein
MPGERGPPRLAAAAVSPILLLVFSLVTCFPIAAMSRFLGLDPMEAARVGILWTVVPSPVLMIPQIDLLVTALGAVAVCLFWQSLPRPGPRSSRARARARTLATVGGAFAGLAVFVSYGAGLYVAFGGLLAITCVVSGRSSTRFIIESLLFALSGAAAVLFAPVLLGYDPIASMRVALGTHLDDYTHQRSYWNWLAFNLWDVAIFLSVPLVILGLARVSVALRELIRNTMSAFGSPAVRLVLGAATLLLALDLSGLVRGETGRIWMPLLPYLLLVALVRRDASAEGKRAFEVKLVGPTAREAAGLAVLLLAHCWVLRGCWKLP